MKKVFHSEISFKMDWQRIIAIFAPQEKDYVKRFAYARELNLIEIDKKLFDHCFQNLHKIPCLS